LWKDEEEQENSNWGDEYYEDDLPNNYQQVKIPYHKSAKVVTSRFKHKKKKTKQLKGKLFCSLSESALKHNRWRYEILNKEFRVNWPKDTVTGYIIFYISVGGKMRSIEVTVPKETRNLFTKCLAINTPRINNRIFKTELLMGGMMQEVAKIQKKIDAKNAINFKNNPNIEKQYFDLD